jgi:hypothetical protein
MTRRPLLIPALRPSAVAGVLVATLGLMMLSANPGMAKPKLTKQECDIDYFVCMDACRGPVADLGQECRDSCSTRLDECYRDAPEHTEQQVLHVPPRAGVVETGPERPVVHVPASGGVVATDPGQPVFHVPASGGVTTAP